MLTDFLNEGRRRKYYLAGSGRQAPQEMPVWFLTLKVPFLDFESFVQDIAQVSTSEAFFIIKNIFITKTLTDFRKPLVNTRLLCLNKTWKLFVPTWKSVWYIMNGIGTDLEHVDYGHTHKTSNRCGLPRVWCTKSQSSLLNIYFHLSGYPV